MSRHFVWRFSCSHCNQGHLESLLNFFFFYLLTQTYFKDYTRGPYCCHYVRSALCWNVKCVVLQWFSDMSLLQLYRIVFAYHSCHLRHIHGIQILWNGMAYCEIFKRKSCRNLVFLAFFYSDEVSGIVNLVHWFSLSLICSVSSLNASCLKPPVLIFWMAIAAIINSFVVSKLYSIGDILDILAL